MKVNISTLTKDQLIANLWRTDELVNEIDILNGEINKKIQTIDNYVISEQEKYVIQAIEDHANSKEVKEYEAYEALVQKVADYKTISIIADIIVSVLLGDLLFVFGVPFMAVAIFWVICPFVLYFIYKKVMAQYLAKKEPTLPSSEETIRQRAMQSLEYREIVNSMVPHYGKQEIAQLKQKIEALENLIREESVLKEDYWLKANKVVSYLENQLAENLKEALTMLANDEHREQIKEMVTHQNQEIAAIRSTTQKLIAENEKLVKQVARQQELINDLRLKK